MAEDTPLIKTEAPDRPEILDSDGNNLDSRSKLDSIFASMEQGKTLDEAVSKADGKKEPEKKEIVAEKKEGLVRKEEPKTEEKPKDKTLEQEMDLREQLRRESEVKETPKVEDKQEDTKDKDDDVSPDELQVLVHDKPKTAKRIQKLLDQKKELDTLVSTTKQEAKDKADKLAELEKKLSEAKIIDPETQKKVDEQLGELAMFRRRYSLEQDPEVKVKFDTRIESAEQSILSNLKRRNAGDAFLNLVKEEGGWTKFSESTRTFNTVDGKSMTCAEAAEAIMASLPLGERKAIEASMIEQIATSRDKGRYFEEQQKSASDYFKNKEAEVKKQQEDFQKQSQSVQKTVTEFRDKFIKDTPWLQDAAIPDSATPDEKKAIEDDNRYTGQLRQLVDKAIAVKDPNEALQVVKESVQYWQERRAHAKTLTRVKTLEAEVEALKNKEAKFKNGARSVAQAGSLTGGNARQGAPASPKKPQSLEEAMGLIEQGVDVNSKNDSED